MSRQGSTKLSMLEARTEAPPASRPRRHETILVVDDDAEIRALLLELLRGEGYHVRVATAGDEALRMMAQSDALDELNDDAQAAERLEAHIDLALLDLVMPNLDGLEVLQQRAGARSDIAMVMLTAYGHSDKVVRATQFGAAGYICKPFDIADMLRLVRNVLDERYLELHGAICDLSQQRADPSTHIIGQSRAMLDVFRLMGLAARSSSPVLVTGENGTGKELVAATIHWASPRAREAYTVLNCATVPESLMESTLFGAYRYFYTDGKRDHMGVFEQANGGTLFLDEIGEMSAKMQSEVLRVLENGVVQRLGAQKGQQIHVDVRLIAATNRDLAVERAVQRFRDDLFHRLHVVPIHLPPLRERRSDIPALIAHFLDKHKGRAGRAAVDITTAALEKLQDYDWPGNVRELENVIISALVRSGGKRITPAHVVLDDGDALPALIDVRARVMQGMQLPDMLRELRAVAFQVALASEHGDVERAAMRLGMDRNALADLDPV